MSKNRPYAALALFAVCMSAAAAAPAVAGDTPAKPPAPAAPAAAPPDPAGDRLGEDVVPTFQEIVLALDAEKPDYTGSTITTLEVKKTVTSFRLNAKEIDVKSAKLSGAKGDIPVMHAAEGDGFVRITPKAALVPGKYTLALEFANNFDTRGAGLYKAVKDGTAYTFTQFEPNDARLAFPCWDEPAFKIPFRFTLSVPEAHVALTNTLPGKETKKDGWKTIVYNDTKPLPTYLLAIATGPFEVVPVPNMKVPTNIVTVKGQKHLTGIAAEMTPALLASLEKWFGTPYPYEKNDFIAVPEYWQGAMENPGLITFNDAILLVDPKAASVHQRRNVARVVAHELAHMWFGDLVTMRWWDDLWLNESFAEWLGTRVVDEVHPQFGMGIHELSGAQGVMVSDARPSTEPIRRKVGKADDALNTVGLAYDKGQLVLGMFEQWLGAETFRKGVNDYLREHAWGNATADDLWRALSKAAGKNVEPVMSTFLDQPGVPLVSATVLDDGRVKLTQRRFANAGVDLPPMTWKIPVGIDYSENGKVSTKLVLLEGAEMTVKLGSGKPDWIMPNSGARGYYRWTVPTPMLLALAKNAAGHMDVAERVGYAGNLSALLIGGQVHGDDFMRALAELTTDPNPQVVSYAVNSLTGVEMPLVTPELEDEYAIYVRKTFRPVLDRYGMEARPGEDDVIATVRPNLLALVGDDGGDPEVRAFAKKKAREYMTNPASIDPGIAGTVLVLAALDGDRALYDEYKAKFEAAQVPAERGRYLGALGAFRNPELREAALAYGLTGPLRPNEVFAIPFGSFDSNEGRARTFKWFMENFDTIKQRVPPIVLSFLPSSAGGCEEDRVVKAREFYGAAERKVEGTERTLAKLSDQVVDCVRLRQRESAAVAGYLKEIAAGATR